jgi:anti-anti-sigma regulatory factor
MKPFEIIESSEQPILVVRGEITIQNAQECLAILRDFQGRGNHLLLNLQNVTGADISFLQLLCSFHRTCLNRGQQVGLAENMSEAFQTVLESTGYRRSQACSFANNNPCLWSGRESI